MGGLFCHRLLRRTADTVTGGGGNKSLGIRLRRFAVYAAPLPMFKAQFVDNDGALLLTCGKCLQWLTALRVLEMGSCAEDLQHIADSCRLRHSSSSPVFESSLREIRDSAGHLDARLAYPFRYWRRCFPTPGVLAALELSSPQAALMNSFRGEVDLRGRATEVLRRRARRWATADEV